MTDRDWNHAVDPTCLLSHLRETAPMRPLRLFGVACCRRLSGLLSTACLEAIDVAQRFAEGAAEEAEFAAARQAVAAEEHAAGSLTVDLELIANLEPAREVDYLLASARDCAIGAVRQLLSLRPCFHDPGQELWVVESEDSPFRLIPKFEGADHCARAARRKLGEAATLLRHGPGLHYNVREQEGLDAEAEEAAYQAAALRDLFPNPARLPSTDITQAWCCGSSLSNFVRHILASNDFSVMPILADALAEAGCPDAEIIAHCRNAPFHVRGCWVLEHLSKLSPQGTEGF